MSTSSFSIGPTDGWVKVIDGNVVSSNFINITGYPRSQPFYVYSHATLAPTAADVGIIAVSGHYSIISPQNSDTYWIRVPNVIPESYAGSTKLRLDIEIGKSSSTRLSSPDGSSRVSVEGVSPTCSAGITDFTPAATPTDIAAIAMSFNGAVLKIKRVTVSGVATSAATIDVLLQKSVNGGGGTAVTVNTGKHDIRDTAPTGTLSYYTANRTSNGNGVSATRPVLRTGKLTFATATTAGTPVEWLFGRSGAKSLTIKDLSDWVVVNLNGQTMPAGATLSIDVEWQEERAVRVGFFGDSTTSNAVNGLLNGGANSGGMGAAGLINSEAIINNYGSNGFRAYDAINNTNSVTYPQQAVQAAALDVLVICYLINDIRMGLCSLNQAIALLDTMIYSVLNGTTSGQVYVSPKATSFAISSMSWAANVVTVNTVQPHGWQVGGTVNAQIAGCTPSGYNGFYPLTITGANTFTYPLVSNPGTATVFGTATYATQWATTNVALPDCKIILWGPNGFTADDAGDGPHFYLSATGNTVLSGLWTGMTLAQAAQAGSQLLYSAYAAFAGDTRLFAVLQKQDLMTVSPADNKTLVPVFPTYAGVANNADTPTAGTLATTMVNQIHPGPRGQILEARQVIMPLASAINSATQFYY